MFIIKKVFIKYTPVDIDTQENGEIIFYSN